MKGYMGIWPKLYDFGCIKQYECLGEHRVLLAYDVCNKVAVEMNDCDHFYTLSLSRHAEIPCPEDKIEIVEKNLYEKYVICRR